MLRSRALSVLAASVLAGSVVMFAPATTASAEPSPTLVKTLLTDVTGDGRKDRVELFALGSDLYRLTVTAARIGTVSSAEFTSQPGDRMDAADVLYGAAAIDGTKGMELIVNLWADSPISTADNRSLAVYTWRSGTLITEKAPKASWGTGWFFGYSWTRTQGYRFFDSHGRRYVDVSDLSYRSGSQRWVGKITRSVWRKGAWVKVSTRSVRLTQAKAQPYLRYDGPYLLKSVLNTDIDGDARADELRYYLYRDVVDGGKYRLKITTAKAKVVTRKWSSPFSEPLVGAAALDGVAGAELILLRDQDRPTWQVLTWRGGKLASEAAPARCGGATAGGSWAGCSDEGFIQFGFTTESGARIATVLSTWDHYGDSGTLHVDRSVWQSGKWVRLAGDTQALTPDSWATLNGNFAGVALLTP